ncbi:MAG: nickel transporter [Rhodocyclaceae bacterium]|nr:nickel transporter [Rhodocyclaceae bacterium]MBX3669788.1 nickel transporter [Rhodocyclaceae bacterium]
MSSLPPDWYALALVVFGLGLRHGFDPDHLATIDGLTRCNASVNPHLARFCGVLFALGHGAVIVAVALCVSVLSSRWDTPEWLETTGAWISIGFLVLLGCLNLRAVLQTAPLERPKPSGLRARMLGPLAQAARPALVALVGALFALSFDALSLAALFAWTGSQHGGWPETLLLALLFALGMLIVDGANGLWVARLLRRTDRAALNAARVMSLAVALASLLVAGMAGAKMLWPAAAVWNETQAVALSTGLLAMLTGAYLLAQFLARRQALGAGVNR